MPIVQFPPNNGYHSPQNGVFYEAVGTGNTATTGSLSWTHSSLGGPLCCILITYSISYSTTAPTITMVYGGVPMTNLGGVNYLTGATVLATGIGYVLGGVPAGSQTVTATAVGGTIHDFAANSLSFLNVAGFPVSNSATANANSTSATCALSTGFAGCMTLGVISPNGIGLTGINHPFVWNDGLFNSIACPIPNTSANPTVTLSATLTSATTWGEILFAMAPPIITNSLTGPKGQALSTAIPRASTF
jgi:hypothetical protein